MTPKDTKIDKDLAEESQKASDQFEKRLDDVMDMGLRAKAKGDFIRDNVLQEFREDSVRLTAAKDIEQKQAAEKSSTDVAYQKAKTEIKTKHKDELAKLHERYTDTLKAYGSREGKSKLIDTKTEMIDFVKYGFAILKNMDLRELVNTVNDGTVYEKADKKDKKMFDVISKVEEGKQLEKTDYEDVAERMVNLSKSDTSAFTIDLSGKGKMEDEIAAIGKTAVLSAAMLLTSAQRHEVGKALIEKYGDDGARVIHEMTKIGYFTVMQTDQLIGSAEGLSSDVLAMHGKAKSEGTYQKGQEEMVEMQKDASKNFDKMFHSNIAKHYMSYMNILGYEIVGRAAIAIAVLNLVINAKNKDVEGVLLNVPMWGGLATGAALYEVVTEGGLRRLAAGASKTDEEKAREVQAEKETKFKKSYLNRPELGKWFKDNLPTINDGFEKINEKHEKGGFKATTFAGLGIENPPSEMDGVTEEKLMLETISGWYESIYSDMKKIRVPDQKAYLEEIEKSQFVTV
ncbi:MAG: hypothetical protein UV80_C0009G0008 [Candidatus Peregrinibacteria bacterium GW2011_GWF2_43_17]|nr:MAG: hypothetical protein UV80_C0009G0008 [Candidatus Peregrinibacteria bacterium GW2011_GWF2_43_17]KKT20633.1 MAG: hypothetical protein UW03_C0001G0003 [Candidatus Peregrinibacteria bacterium GW2011_GWA2_43_8]HAU39322.1 hypothetical protein [Candidatus Peregrinibacteria bacterium]